MYINIAICDDELIVCGQLERYITDILTAKEIEFNIDVFMSGDTLCNALNSKSYDLIFQDIELPGINGVEVGSFIRNVLNNNTLQIVYISAVQSYAMALFESRPLNFLVKPLDIKTIRKVLEAFLNLFCDTENFFTFKINGHFHKLPLSDILYFESRKRKVTVVTRNNSYEFYDSLKNIEQQISSAYFVTIHQSVLVNFNHVTFFEYDNVTMSDGTVLPVSQSRRSTVRNKYLTHITGDSND